MLISKRMFWSEFFIKQQDTKLCLGRTKSGVVIYWQQIITPRASVCFGFYQHAPILSTLRLLIIIDPTTVDDVLVLLRRKPQDQNQCMPKIYFTHHKRNWTRNRKIIARNFSQLITWSDTVWYAVTLVNFTDQQEYNSLFSFSQMIHSGLGPICYIMSLVYFPQLKGCGPVSIGG